MSLYRLVEESAQAAPESPAILSVEPGCPPLTYAGLLALVQSTVRALNDLGIGRGDRVASVLQAGPEMATAFVALASGTTSAPLNPAYRAKEYDFYLTDLRAKALLVLAGQESPAIEVARSRGIAVLELVPTAGAPAGTFTIRGEKLDRAARPGYAEADDTAIVLHTSGTTSRPKIVPLTQSNVCAATWAICEATRLTAADRCLNVMPLFHIHGLSALLGSIAVRGSCVCPPGFLAPKYFEWVEAFAPSWYTAAPTIHQAILDRAPQHLDLIERKPLRFMRSASSAMLPQVIAEMERVFAAPFIEAYGMTEAAPQISANPLPPAVRKRGSVGLPAGTEVAILDQEGNILATGERGEVSIKGPNVMKGYENNPGADKVAFTNGWFRTGDQGYLDADGYLFITGRLKEIINRGGEKISPREVDEVLIDHPAVARVVTFSVPDPKLGEDVAAVVVLKPGARATERDLREFAASRLADFKVPRQVVFRDEIPQGATAKAVRIGLAEKLGITAVPQPKVGDRAAYEPPKSDLEKTLVPIWGDVLGVDKVGAADTFFELGGDSVLATQLLARVRDATGVELTLLALFEEASTPRGMAECIEKGDRRAVVHAPIERVPEGHEMPLSFAQEGLWFADQLDPGHPVYNVYRAVRLHGKLDVDALEKGINAVVERHEALRTTFPAEDGRPKRVIASKLTIPLIIVDLSGVASPEPEIERITVKEALRPFDIAKDAMLRAILLSISPVDHVVVLVAHHIAADAWSLQVLLGELAVLYSDFARGKPASLPPLPIQDKDFALWQRRVQSEAFDKQVSYWKDQLADAPPALDLPADHPRPSVKSYRGARLNITLPDEITTAIRKLSQREGVTIFMTLLAAYDVLLYRATKQEDILVGTHTAGRTRVETEGLIGAFINTLVLRANLSQNPTFKELVARVRKMALGAYEHQDLPFNKLLEAVQVSRNLGRGPLFQVKFRLQNVPAATLDFSGLEAKLLEIDYGMIKADLGLELLEKPEGLGGFFEYSTDLFDRKTIESLWADFLAVLRAVTADPIVRLGALVELLKGKPAMEEKKPEEPKAKTSLKGARRKASVVTTGNLVKTSQLVESEAPIFLLVEPAADNVDLVEWAAGNKEWIDEHLLRHGAILFRGFPVDVGEFEKFAKVCTRTLLEYKNGSTPRSQVSGNVYTSTEFPKERSIPMHNEMSYTTTWPLKLWFHCVKASETGGETPLADSVKVFARLSDKLKDRFREKKVLYVRNFMTDYDVPWQKVFMTEDKKEVERFCAESGIELEWMSGGGLRTKQLCQAIAEHPVTGDPVFFNQAHLFNLHALLPVEREGLLMRFGKENLPRNSYYGDGTDIEDEALDEIQRVYDETQIAFPWKDGDVVMVDNMRVAHGRRPFTGARKIVVAMAEPYGAA